MHVRLVRVQLSEAGYLVANSLFTFPAREKAKPTLELDLLLERNLRAGEQAHCHVWFPHGGKTARDRVVELRRYEFVSDLCGSGRHMVQTVVAHRRKLPAWDSRDWLSFSEKRLKRQWQSCVDRCHLEIEKNLARPLVLWLEALNVPHGGGGHSRPASQKSKTTELLRRTAMKFRPLHDRVVIKRIEAEEKTSGGIIIPDTAKEKPQEGEVIAVGPGGRDESGKLIPIDVKVGDRVLFGKWSGTEVKIDGVEYMIMKESDLMGVLVEAGGSRKAA